MIQPHDLIRLRPSAVEHVRAGSPPWAAASLSTAPWVVVRRARARPGFVPAGVRGDDRSRRFACEFPLDACLRIVRPEHLVSARPARDVPAFDALAAFADVAREYDLTWGPAGSAGFELATGWAVVRPDSDCDIVVRAGGLSMAQLVEINAVVKAIVPRIDVELDYGTRAVALAEAALGTDRVMAKTPDGVELIAWTALV